MWNIPDKVANNGASLTGKHLHSEFNNRQRELEKAVSAAGITLSAYPTDPNATPDADETMLAQAMSRMASLGICGIDNGAANAYVLSASGDVVAPKALFDGMLVTTVPAATNTDASTANVFGLGVKPLRNWQDEPLRGREILSGRPTAWRYKSSGGGGSGAWHIVPWDVDWHITTAIVITVGGGGPLDHPTLAAAMDWLSYRQITTTGSVTIQLPAGQIALGTDVLKLAHPNADKITLQGAALTGGGFPTDASFQVTNNTPGARTADAAANLAMLEARFPTRLQFDAGGGVLVASRFAAISRILIKGTAGSNTPLLTRAADCPINEMAFHGGKVGLHIEGGHTSVGKVAAINCSEAGVQGYGGAVGNGSTILAYQCKYGVYLSRSTHLGADGGLYARGNETGLSSYGGQVTCTAELSVLSTNELEGAFVDGGHLYAPGLHANGNGRNGVQVQGGGRLVTVDRSNVTTTTEIKNNGVDGVVLFAPAAWVANQASPSTMVMSGNGGRNVYAVGGGSSATLSAAGVNLTAGGGTSIVAYTGAQIDTRTAAAVGTVSPALNTLGNFNAYIAN